MATIGSLVVNLVANTSQFSGGMKKGINDTKQFEKRISEAGSSVDRFIKITAGVVAGAVVFRRLSGAISSVVQAASESEDILAQLDAVLRSTKEAAGFNAQELHRQADALQATSKFSNESVTRGQALLLTFTNIKETLPDTTQTMLDMSQALGQDLKASAIQLGKALNDPIKGVSALSEVGVSFTQDQRDLIKSLQETGRLADAQRVILAELAKEFGGSAAASVETFSGKLTLLNNNWQDFKANLGGQLVELSGITTFIDWINEAADRSEHLIKIAPKVTAAAPQAAPKASGLPPGQAIANRVAQIDVSKFKTEAEVIKAAGEAAGSSLAFASIEVKDAFWEARDAQIEAFKWLQKNRQEEERAKMKEVRQREKMARFGNLLDIANSAQFVGKNRLGNLFAGKPNSTTTDKPIPVVVKERPLFASSTERGSVGHLEAIIKQRGGTFDASFMDLSREQLKTLQSIDRKIDSGGVGVV